MIEAILFGLFTLCMICDQWSSVSSGSTQIDRLKASHATSLPRHCHVTATSLS